VARVPSYGVPQVQARVTPNVRIDDSGANEMRRAGSAMAQGMQDVAGVAAKIGEQAQAEVNATRLMQTQRRLQEMSTGLLNDPEKGAFARQGEAAINVDKEVMPEWDRQASEIVSGLPPALRARAEEWVGQYRTSADTQLKRHALQEGRRFRVGEAEATVVTHVKAGAMNFQDPDAVDMAGRQAGASAAELARLMGEGPAAAKVRADEARSATYAGALERMLTADPVNGPMRAQQRLDAWKPLMTPDHAAVIESKIAPIMAEMEIESIVDAEEAGIPTTTILPPQRGKPTQAVVNAIEAASIKHGVPQEWLFALAEQESSFNPKAYNGEHGAAGIVQYIPSTAQQQGIDPYDVNQAIDAAARQFAERMKKGGASFAVAAHFAGDGGAEAVVNRGRTAENPKTAQYITEVTGRAMRWRQQLGGKASEDGTDPRMENPLFRRRVEARKREREQVRKAQESEAERSMLESIYTKIEDGDPTLPPHRLVSPDELAYLKRSGRLDSIEARLRGRREGDVAVDNPAVVGPYLDLLRRNPSAFAQMDVHRNADHMTKETRKQLLTWQDEVRAGKFKPADYATENEQITQFVYRPLKLEGDGSGAKRARFESAWFEMKKEHVKKTGEQPDATEREAMLKRLVVSFSLNKASTGGEFTPNYEAAGLPTKVPDAERALILDAYQRRGLPAPDDKTVRALYLQRIQG
jgi:soluble lytic murein transglycosylase-like protein